MRNTNQRRRDSRQQDQFGQQRDSRGRYTNNYNRPYTGSGSRNSEMYGYDYDEQTENQNRQYDYFDEMNPGRNLPNYTSSENRGYSNRDQYGGNSYQNTRGENQGRDWGFGRSWNQNENESDYSQRGQSGSTPGSWDRQSYNSGSTYGEHRGKGPKGYQRSDDRIQEDISDELSDDGQIDASEIEVSVNSGEVTLTGTVSNREAKRKAEDIVESISGVKNVENRIRVAGENRGAESKSNGSGYRKTESAMSGDTERTRAN